MVLTRLKSFFTPFDARFEDLKKGNPVLNVLHDFTAGLVVAMIAIPLGMGLAMTSGLRPEQGILAGAIAGIVGALFGGSKYQVYGPTAAFIPTIAAIMHRHGTPAENYSFLILAALVAAVVLLAMGLMGAGRLVRLVPHSIVVGFTIGIALSIALSQGAEIFGLHLRHAGGHPSALHTAHLITTQFGELEIWAVVLALATVFLIKGFVKISIFIPGPFIVLALCSFVVQAFLPEEGLMLVKDKFGAVSLSALHITLPSFEPFRNEAGAVLYAAFGIVLISAIESLLCSHLADRLAKNKGTPYDADKELWGQGVAMAVVPLLNGFPTTGALARTATNIKLGAISPLSLVFHAGLKLLLAYYVAQYLGYVPMACVGGVLLYVATNMVKREEIEEVLEMGRGHTWLMALTVAAVVGMDFLRGVLLALAIYAIWQVIEKSLKKPAPSHTLGIYKEHGARGQHDDGHAESHAVANLASSAAHEEHPVSTVRAVVESKGHGGSDLVKGRTMWLANIRRPGSASRSAYVHKQANVAGRVVLGDHVHIAAGASVRADEGTPFYIGSNTNIQDGVVIHALEHKHVLVDGEPWAVYVGRNVSIAHDALVHGPCHIGDHTFIGFKAVVHDAVVGAHCFIGIGAIVVGVEVADGRFVAPGSIIDTSEKARKLPPAEEKHHHFNRDVVEVNRGLAAAYRENASRDQSPTHDKLRKEHTTHEL
ncbi:MAG: hypothetical protein KBF88_00870, partial [Polyangiaceae bacterium]|nr:hypothetical protein [Polyangiaceae bacterium]